MSGHQAPRQLAFDLPHRPARGRDDFFVSPANAEAVALIEGWARWPGARLVLTGPAGAGKSHLAEVWAGLSGARLLAGRADVLAARPEALAGGQAVVVDDADSLAGDDPAEAALFHLHNLVLAEGGALLLTARTPPRDWGLCLPDLASRVQAAPLARLHPPDDALLAAVLVKLFADRQIAVTPGLVQWLMARLERSFEAAHAIVAAIDAEALATGQRPGIGLARALLDKSSPEAR